MESWLINFRTEGNMCVIENIKNIAFTLITELEISTFIALTVFLEWMPNTKCVVLELLHMHFLVDYTSEIITCYCEPGTTSKCYPSNVYIGRPTKCTDSYNESLLIIKCLTFFGLLSPLSGATFFEAGNVHWYKSVRLAVKWLLEESKYLTVICMLIWVGLQH